MEKRAKVSIILPTYNRADSVAASIKSIISQTYVDFELLIVDDGSTDDTENVVKNIPDERIRYIKISQNGGVSNARNIGVSESLYDLIAFEDSDDLWHIDKLEKQIDYLAKNPDNILVYCAYEIIGGSSNIGIRIPSAGSDVSKLEGNIYPYLLQRNTIGAPTVVMRKDVFNRIGGFKTSYPALEDWDLAIRVAKLGSIGYLDETLLDVSVKDGGVSSSSMNYYKARCMLLSDYLEDINELGLFDLIAGDILNRAAMDGAIEFVKKTMMLQILEKQKNT